MKNISFEKIFLWFVFIVITSIYIKLYTGISKSYLPVWSDEFFYYVNSYSFYKNSSLRAALTYSGEGSKVFGADAHGFAYTLFNGSIAKIVGWRPQNFIILNLIMFLAAISLIWLLKSFSTVQKLVVSIFLLLFPFFPLYGFTFMQEIIHIFFAIILSILLYLLNQNKTQKNVALYIVTIFIAGLFRPLWFWWLIALIPYANTTKQRLFYFGLFSIGAVLSYLVVKLFSEPVPNFFSSVIDLLKKGEIIKFIIAIYQRFIENFKNYIIHQSNDTIYFFMKITTLILVVYFTFRVFQNRVPLYISLASVGILNFLLLFVLYDAYAWREIRTMSTLFYFYSLFVFTDLEKLNRYTLLILFIIIFRLNFDRTQNLINERNVKDIENLKTQQMAYANIANIIPDNSTIYINYFPQDYSFDLLLLPVQNNNKKPIRYIVPYYIFENIKFDYVLQKPSYEPKPNETIILKNDYFVIYKQNQ